MLKNSGGRNFEKNLVIFSFTIIPVLLILTFSYYPLLKMFQYSLHDWNGYSVNPKFVGLENYKTVLTNPNYFTVLKPACITLLLHFSN